MILLSLWRENRRYYTNIAICFAAVVVGALAVLSLLLGLWFLLAALAEGVS